MCTWRRILLAILLLIASGLGAWCYAHRRPLARQWTLYRIGAAASQQEADAEIVRSEDGPDHRDMIRELVHKWGTGNRQFDLHLAAHLGAKSCGEPLREAFAAHIGRRKTLLCRWAHYWAWRAPLQPEQQVASVVAYLEVLDLQAVFQLTDCGDLAKGLSPANWRDRYAEWQRSRPVQLPRISRPEGSFP
jgi:hypothetical protein